MCREWKVSVLLVAVIAGTAFAQVAGKWTGGQKGPGPPMPVVLELKVSGSTLTGTYVMGTNPPVQIANGKVNASKVTFSTAQALRGNKIETAWTGEAKGDELLLTRQILVNGRDYGGRGSHEPVKLTRAK